MDNLNFKEIKGYTLIKQIGAGGFGAVYEAYQEAVDRVVAIKVILPAYANEIDFIRNFDIEAHLIARLEHPFIVPLYDYWREPSGAYLVMRYYPLGNLSDLLSNQSKLAPEHAAKILEQIASALDTAHDFNIVHRDIKPANILLDASGNAYLTDFGLAKDMTLPDSENKIVGSPAYISPELLRRQTASNLSDIYSLGFVLYEMLTGTYAFDDITPTTSIITLLDYHLHRSIPDIPFLPDSANAVIQRATAKDPADRYQSALEFAKAFREALSDSVASDSASMLIYEHLQNPYKGLRAFDEADAHQFLGRNKLVKLLLQALDADTHYHNFLALVGASGSGKSSVVRAGLIPAVRAGELADSSSWFIVDMVPSTDPIVQLSAGLNSIASEALDTLEEDLRQDNRSLLNVLPKLMPYPADKILLVIDQFEEVFTQTSDVRLRRHFLDLLYQAIEDDRFYLVIVLRADFYDRPLMHEGFGQLMQARTQVVLPLNSLELNDVIKIPALNIGLEVENELLAAMIADVQHEAVALPLLQYALTEVYERRESNKLSLSAYHGIGGIAGALAHRADELYQELNAQGQDAARQIFLRLVTLGEGMEDTRRRAKQSELLSVVQNPAVLNTVLDAFGNARLLTFDKDEETREPTIEVAHEALIREWLSLRAWLDESRDDIRRQRLLGVAAQQWTNARYDNSYLLRGSQLLEIQAWSANTNIQLNAMESRFLQASLNERERLETLEQSRQAHEAQLENQSRQRLQYLLILFAFAGVFGIALSLFAFSQANSAAEARDLAQSAGATSEANNLLAQARAEEARSLALAASAEQALAAGNTELALVLALAAVDIDTSVHATVPPLAYDALVSISHAAGLIYEAQVTNAAIEHIDVSPDSRYAVFGRGRNSADYWTLFAGRLPTNPNNPRSPVGGQGNPPPRDPNIDFSFFIWDLETRTSLPKLENNAPVTDVLFIPSGEERYLLATANDNGAIMIWDLAEAQRLHEINFSAGFLALSATSDGTQLFVSATGLGEIPGGYAIIDTATGEIIRQFALQEENLAMARVNSSGTKIVSLFQTSRVLVWDSLTGETLLQWQIEGNARPQSLEMYISPDDKTLAINRGNQIIPLWDITTGESLGLVQTGTTASHRIAFNSDGSRLMAVARDGLISIWDLEGQYFVRQIQNLSTNTVGLVWSPDDQQAIISTNLGTLRVYAVEPDPIDRIAALTEYNSRNVLLSSDSSRAYATRNGLNPDLYVINLTSLEEQFLAHLPSENTSISLSPDNTQILLRSGRQLQLLDAQTGESLPCAFCQMPDSEAPLNAEFLPSLPSRVFIRDGQQLRLLDAATGEIFWINRELRSEPQYLSISEDGEHIALGLGNQTIAILNAATGTEEFRSMTDEEISTLALNDDGSRLAYSTKPSFSIHVVNLETGETIQSLVGHDLEIRSLEFSHGGQELLSSSNDTSVIYWDLNTGAIINRLQNNVRVFNAMFYGDESQVIMVSEDRPLELWQLVPMSLEEAIQWTYEHRAVRDLTESECARYPFARLCD